MMKKFFITFLLFKLIDFSAQVGINTTAPNATLDVNYKTGIVNPDGIKPPKVSKTYLASKNATVYGANQNGTIVYIEDFATPSSGNSLSQVVDIKGKGFYYFDSKKVNATAPQGRWVALYDGDNVSIPLVTGTMVPV